MSPVFEIIPEAIFFQQTNLICEISCDGFSYIFENDIDKKFYGLSVFYFNNDEDVAEQLKTIFNEQPLLNKNYKQVVVIYTGSESALLPEELYKPGKNDLLLSTLYGDINEGTIATDFIADKKIYNVYKMPAAIHQIIISQFPLAAFNHLYSLLIKQKVADNDLLKIIFYRDTFIAVLLKEGKLQLVQTYLYLSGTDVAYHILNICKQFNLIDLPLQITGMIEINSDLHKELSHYFKNIFFGELPTGYEFAKDLKELPPHYFSHLFSFALCV